MPVLTTTDLLNSFGEKFQEQFLDSVEVSYRTAKSALTLENVSNALSRASHVQRQPRDRFYCLSVVAPECCIVHELLSLASAKIELVEYGLTVFGGVQKLLELHAHRILKDTWQ